MVLELTDFGAGQSLIGRKEWYGFSVSSMDNNRIHLARLPGFHACTVMPKFNFPDGSYSQLCIDPRDWSPVHNLIDPHPASIKWNDKQISHNWNLSPSMTKMSS